MKIVWKTFWETLFGTHFYYPIFFKFNRYALKIGAKAFMTSSFTGENVDAVFQYIADIVASKPKDVPQVLIKYIFL